MASPEPVGPAGPESAAAAWYARRSSGQVRQSEQEKFGTWLAADPANARAYEKVATMLESLGGLQRHADITALRADASALVRTQRRNRNFVRLAWASGFAVAAVLFGTWQLSIEHMRLQTAPGELRHTVFSDGTQAWLGSDSRVNITYSHSQRAVAVERGEAFFDVAQNKQRPFVVSGQDHTVTAIGTAFDIRVFRPTLTVTLLRGSVSVRGASGDGGAETRLKPGQQYRLDGAAAAVRDVDAEAQVAWYQGLIELDDTSLGEAVATFNHNSRVKLLIGDQKLAALRVSGTFHTGRAWDFAGALELELPVVAEKLTSGDILLKYR
jgi:transmembrane sensor